MARWSGLIGFAHQVRTRPGVTSEVLTEKGPYFGTVTRASLAYQNTNSVNTDLRSANTIEVMADDQYLSENIFAIRYVEWAGAVWSVVDAAVQRPRLLLRLGGVYDGPRAEPAAGEEAGTPDTP